MKDIDFDELDRAVNSLMANSGAASSSNDATKPEAEVVKDRTEPSDLTVDSRVPADSQVPGRGPSTSEQRPTRQQAATPRRSGRFMDIVHGSSDMRSPARSLTPPSKKAARFDSVTLQPTGADVTAAEPTPSYESATTTPGPSTTNDSSGAMPDPIDFAMQTTSEADSEASGDQVESRPYSPFVPDAKVEKRPLGSAGVVAPAVDESVATRVLEPDVENQLPATPDELLPAELQKDLIAIESGDPVAAADQEAGQLDVSADTDSASHTKEEPDSTKIVAAETSPLKVESIPNQYASQPKKTESEVEADIFNTEALSKPLAHPAKKRSGWLTVVLIILLVILGAGLGALVYLFVL